MMHMQRFDFAALQDFRMPLKPAEAFEELKLVEKEVAPPPPPPPPSFSEAELEAAKAKAKEEGRQAGIAEGVAQAQAETQRRDQSIEQAALALVRQAADIQSRHAQLMQDQCTELLPLVMMITRKVAGDAVAAMPEASVETLVKDCLNVLIRQPKICLLVHPTLKDTMADRVNAVITSLRAECALEVVGSDALSPGEARLEWKDGRAERRLDEIWSQIENMLSAVDFASIATSTQPTTPSDHTQPNQTQKNQTQGEQL